MSETIEADICVIGAGSAGLSVAAGAAQLGAETVLVERGAMGGDCLNHGCVPSKALIAAARAADDIRHAGRLGINGHEPAIDFAAVHAHVHGVIDAIAPMDSEARFTGLGVRVLRASARFTGPREIAAGGAAVRARRFVVATGSSPAIPPIPGLDTVPYLTNETVFERDTRPEHLIVIGGGPIGVELAQAHRRLGARVTVVEQDRILARDDPELVDHIRQALVADGVDLREGTGIAAVSGTADGNGIVVTLARDGVEETVAGDALLVAVGRRANVDGLGLDTAGIAHDGKGIRVDARLRTSNKRVFAIGDVAGGPQFTHLAGYHAGVVVKNALFRIPAKVDLRALPRVTFADPELAQVGLTEDEARARHGEIRVLRWGFHENDRAQAERRTEGLVKAICTPRGRILGAGIVGAQAGELIQPWILAIAKKIGIGALATMIAPYPTRGEASKRAAGAFYTPSLFSPRTRRLVALLRRLG
ncbi:MAG: FAD-dependent oxidoreductase [Azospirillaceae bacterium]